MKITVHLIFVILIMGSCFRNPSDNDQEAQYNFEQACKFDSIGEMTPKEQLFSDSMQHHKFEYAKVEHVYHFWRCRGRNELTHEQFFFRYKRKKPVPKSFQTKSESYLREITKLIFTKYISDQDIMKYENFHVEDDFFGVQKTMSRDTIFRICGFKLVEQKLNKWKRVKI